MHATCFKVHSSFLLLLLLFQFLLSISLFVKLHIYSTLLNHLSKNPLLFCQPFFGLLVSTFPNKNPHTHEKFRPEYYFWRLLLEILKYILFHLTIKTQSWILSSRVPAVRKLDLKNPALVNPTKMAVSLPNSISSTWSLF